MTVREAGQKGGRIRGEPLGGEGHAESVHEGGQRARQSIEEAGRPGAGPAPSADGRQLKR